MGAAAEDRHAHAFEVADDELRLVAGHAGMGKARQVGVVDGDAVDRAGQVAEPGAEHEADGDGGRAGAGADGLQGLHQRSLT